MIITKILGGLGNQLFQYAAGYALATQNNSDSKLDLSGFAGYDLRNVELDRFNTRYSIAAQAEIQKLKATNTLQRVTAKLLPAADKRFYKQPSFSFDPAFFTLRPPVYIQGYFQSEKFFAPVKEEVRQAFTFKEPFRNEIQEAAVRLQNTDSVSVHIRRGDYRNADALRVHGVLPMEYYGKAIQLMRETIGSKVRLFVFSDDPHGAQKEPVLNDAETVSGRLTTNHLEDFYLMQHCRHHIIANSSFSWWAAWLNRNESKTVIAPQAWFNEGPKDTQDLLPDNWLRL